MKHDFGYIKDDGVEQERPPPRIKMIVRPSFSKEEGLSRLRDHIVKFRSVERLRQREANELRIAVVGYGPSLIETWSGVSRCDSVVTTSGAHDYLLDRGFKPSQFRQWLHVECDPRPHKVDFVRRARKGITYCIASICHPKMFRRLRNHDVLMWHALTNEMQEQKAIIAELESHPMALGGGTNAGLRALNVAHCFGYRRFDLFGMDCSYRPGKTWAGKHSGQPHNMIEVDCNGRRFLTSEIMLQAADEFFRRTKVLPDSNFRIVGDGLLAERVRLYEKDQQKALEPLDLEFVTKEAA